MTKFLLASILDQKPLPKRSTFFVFCHDPIIIEQEAKATAKEKYHSVTKAKLQEAAVNLFSDKPNLLALTQSLQRDDIKF